MTDTSKIAPNIAYETMIVPNHKSNNVVKTSSMAFCAMVGAGLLSLPHAMSWLGWIGGCITITAFFLISLFMAHILVTSYNTGTEQHGRYHHLVRSVMTQRDALAVSIFQLATLVLVNLAFTIAGAATASGIAKSICTLTGATTCFDKTWIMTLLFGAVETILSQIKNMEETWWMSILGSICSFIYAAVAFGISVSKASNNAGTLQGREADSLPKAFNILNSMGAILFSFSVSQILLEIQDTLQQPPSAIVQMKKVCTISFSLAFCCYMAVSVSGYMAVGNTVDGIIFASFDGPQWALLLGNFAVLLHMVFAFQILAHPVFDTVESHVKWWLLKREAKKLNCDEDTFYGNTTTTTTTTNDDCSNHQNTQSNLPAVFQDNPSPFENRAESQRPQNLRRRSAYSVMGFTKTSLPPLEERMSSYLSHAVSQRLETLKSGAEVESGLASGTLNAHNSHNHNDNHHTNHHSNIFLLHSRHSTAQAILDLQAISPSQMPSRPSQYRLDMFTADTGLANEEIALNAEHLYAPLWARLLLRTSYVALIVIVSIILPFFSAVTGLVGSLTYFPLNIHYPMFMFLKLRGPFVRNRRWLPYVLWTIWSIMLLVSIAAVIASIYTIVESWSNFHLFQD